MDWKKFVAQYAGKKCRLAWKFKNGNMPQPGQHESIAYVFDADDEAVNVQQVIDNVLGDWDTVAQELGRDKQKLAMFATETQDRNPFAMIETIYFYDRTSGELFSYEEGSYEAVAHDRDEHPYRLDQIEIEPQ